LIGPRLAGVFIPTAFGLHGCPPRRRAARAAGTGATIATDVAVAPWARSGRCWPIRRPISDGTARRRDAGTGGWAPLDRNPAGLPRRRPAAPVPPGVPGVAIWARDDGGRDPPGDRHRAGADAPSRAACPVAWRA